MAWRDNVFVERLWRSVKYEEVYLKAYETVSDVKSGLGRYFQFYNTRGPHSSLERQTPDQVYFNRLHTPVAANQRRAVIHLSRRKNCLNNWDHLYRSSITRKHLMNLGKRFGATAEPLPAYPGRPNCIRVPMAFPSDLS